jgi:hypothetical protein
MIHLGLLILTIFSIEILHFFNFKIIVFNNLKLYKKIFRLFRLKKVSDEHKEKVLLKYSKNIFIISIKIILILLSILLLIFILNFLIKDFLYLIFSMLGFLEMIAFFLTYTFLRKYFYAKL